MKKSYLPIIISLILVGCTNSKMELKQEPLTGQAYYLGTIKLLPIKNNEGGSLILKCEKEAFVGNNLIKATLQIVQEDKEYNINPHETLNIYIDDAPLALQIVSSFQEPQDAVSHYPVVMPSGTSVFLGRVREITRRNMSFFLPTDYLSKMMAAKKVVFEISSAVSVESPSLQKYPIALELSTEDFAFLQEFKSNCVSNVLNQTGVER